MKTFVPKLFGCLAVLFFSKQISFSQQAGSLDPSFGKQGRQVVNPANRLSAGNSINKVLKQSDGKLIVIGSIGTSDLMVSRYLPNGTKDLSYGKKGTVIYYGFPSHTAVLDATDRLVIGGYGNVFRAARLNSNGTIDRTFGTNGIASVTYPNSSGGYANTVAIQPDGKIVLAGVKVGGQDSMEVARLLSNGLPDNTFDGDGVLVTNIKQLAGSNSRANAVAVQNDGKILVAGESTASGFSTDSSAVIRLNADGTFDNSFGKSGRVILSLNVNSSKVNVLALQQDGKIILGGVSNNNTQMAITRLRSNGIFDSTFPMMEDG